MSDRFVVLVFDFFWSEEERSQKNILFVLRGVIYMFFVWKLFSFQRKKHLLGMLVLQGSLRFTLPNETFDRLYGYQRDGVAWMAGLLSRQHGGPVEKGDLGERCFFFLRISESLVPSNVCTCRLEEFWLMRWAWARRFRSVPC